MLLIQFILVIFFGIAVIKVIGRYKANDLRIGGMIYWILFWLVAGVVVVLPDTTFYFARALGVGRGADLVVYVALVTIFFMIFRLLIKIEKLNKDITKLTRKMTLDEKKSLK